jgi:hypothetical protein
MLFRSTALGQVIRLQNDHHAHTWPTQKHRTR